MQIYISGPLQGSGNLCEAKQFYEQLAEMVRDAGHDAYIPHHSTDPVRASSLSAQSVFNADISALNRADAVVAHVGLPSTGVGAELALATASGRRVLGLKRPGERSSRFAEGLLLEAGGRICEFESDAQLRSEIAGWLNMPPAWFGRPRSIESHRKVVA